MQTNLFADLPSRGSNLLPYDGQVIYKGKIFTTAEAKNYYQLLVEKVSWRNDEAFIFGRHFITKRKVAWYGDKPFEYTYSNNTKLALPWLPELFFLKTICEKYAGASYNSCLLNLYHTGAEGMAYHSDDEKTLLQNGSIASLSFGAERKFCFKHKRTGEVVSLILEHGSLLVMTGTTQTHWMHRLPPTKKISNPRVNLTYRHIVK